MVEFNAKGFIKSVAIFIATIAVASSIQDATLAKIVFTLGFLWMASTFDIRGC